MKEFFKSLFGASSKEIVGFSALIVILIISLLVPQLVNKLMADDATHWAEDEKILDSLLVFLENEQSNRQQESILPVKLQPFNPNNSSFADLHSLGFSEKIAQRIINYREKGGSFKIKDDLYKIYDIDSSVIDDLYNFIELPVKIYNENTKRAVANEITNKARPSAKITPVELPNFNINKADTATLKTIKGIGSVLSQRIIDFREKLGGFVESKQLFEVYNLDSLVVLRLLAKMYIDADYIPEKILINEVAQEELAAHPYISWQQARLIVAYRNQHGDYSTAQDLLNVYAISEDDVNRILSYLDWTPSN